MAAEENPLDRSKSKFTILKRPSQSHHDLVSMCPSPSSTLGIGRPDGDRPIVDPARRLVTRILTDISLPHDELELSLSEVLASTLFVLYHIELQVHVEATAPRLSPVIARVRPAEGPDAG